MSIVYDMPAHEYHARTEMSKSGLDRVHRTIADYLYGSMIDRETPALLFGQAYHCAGLEPERYAAEFVAAPKIDRRTTAGKTAWDQFQADNFGKAILTEQDAETIAAMSAALHRHPVAGQLLAATGHTEVSLFWDHQHVDMFNQATIIPMKARLDKESGDAVIDLKTTTDAGLYGFQRSVMKYRYHVQGGLYLDAANKCGLQVQKFIIIAQEKGAPYNVAVYELDEEFLDAGREEYHADLERYADYLNDPDQWTGYPAEITTLSLPRWARPLQEDTDEQE